MSATTGNYSESLYRDSEGSPCRLCMKKNDYYYNIFTSIVASQVTVEDALYDLVDLKVAAGDGLPATLCPLCLRKIIEFYDFRNICHASDAELRKVSSRNNFTSTGEDGAVHDNLRSSTQSKDCVCEAIVGTSEKACSVQPNEIFIPVPDIQLPTANMLSIQGDEAADDVLGSSADTKDFIQDEMQGTSHLTCSVQTTEIYIPLLDSQQLGASMSETLKEENKDPLIEDEYPAMHTPYPAGILRKLLDPLATDDLLNSGENEDPIERSTVAHDSAAKAFGVQTADGMPIQTTSTSYLLAEGNVRNYSINECTGPTAIVTQNDSNAGASLVKTERNLMDEDLDKCGAPDTDMKTNSSIPDDRQCNARNNESHKISGTGDEKTYFGEKGGFDVPNTMNNLSNTRINRSERNGCETVMGNNKGMPNCSIKNPGNSCRSNQNSFHCLNCRDAFNDKNELIEHMKIHFVARNFDAVPESMGDVSLETLPSHKYSSSCELTTSNTSFGLERTKLDPTQKGNVPIKETTGGKGDKKNVRRMTRSFTLEEESTSQSLSSISSRVENQCNRVGTGEKERPYSCSVCAKCFTGKGDLNKHNRIHTGDKPYSCNVCKKSFTQSGNLNTHMRTHAAEKPYSGNECEKSFSGDTALVKRLRTHTEGKPYSCSISSKSFTQSGILNAHIRTDTEERPYSCSECEKSFLTKGHLVAHIRTHTGEKPYTCSVCSKSFTQRGSLNAHIRTHTGSKPFSCNECEKCFSHKSHLVRHIRTHTGEKPYSCNDCEKSFSTNTALVKHLRAHTGERPYSCSICPKSFTQSGSLNRHIRTHTG